MNLSTVEKGFSVLVLLYLTQAFDLLLPQSAGFADPTQGNPTGFLIQLAIYSIAAIFIGLRWRSTLNSMMQCRWIMALVLLALLSALWSSAPDLTSKRALVLLSSTTFGLYFGRRFTIAEQLRLLSYAMALMVVLSIAFVFFLPEYGIAHDAAHFGNWQGIYHQKNMLGRAATLAVVAFCFTQWKGLKSPFRAVFIALSLVIIVMSGSATAIVVLAALLLWIPALRILKLGARTAVPVWIGAAFAAVGATTLVLSNLRVLLALLGRDITLTGRTELWQAVLLSIFRKPWLGYGFGAFWRGLQGDSASVLMAVHWAAMFSHNGFLDLALQLGFAGIVLFTISYIAVFRPALHLAFRAGDREALWPLMFLSFMFLLNFADSTILATNSSYWIIYVSVSASLECARRRSLLPLAEPNRHYYAYPYELQANAAHLS
jgi:O-antigen ligase